MLTWQGSERGVYNMQLCGISMVIGPEGNVVFSEHGVAATSPYILPEDYLHN